MTRTVPYHCPLSLPGMNKMVIGFVSRSDPFHDRVAWSGTTYKLREAIELAGFEVRWIPYGYDDGMLA